MYNYNKLKGRIVEVCGTRREFSKALGVTETTLSGKLSGSKDFTQSEIARSCDILGIAANDIHVYFFS